MGTGPGFEASANLTAIKTVERLQSKSRLNPARSRSSGSFSLSTTIISTNVISEREVSRLLLQERQINVTRKTTLNTHKKRMPRREDRTKSPELSLSVLLIHAHHQFGSNISQSRRVCVCVCRGGKQSPCMCGTFPTPPSCHGTDVLVPTKKIIQ